MAKPSRWNAEKRYQIVKEALSQKEPMGQIAWRHQVSEGLIYCWRDKFFEGGKAALAFDGRSGSKREKVALERQVEDLQKLIGEQAVEIRFLKRLSRAKTELGRSGSGMGIRRTNGQTGDEAIGIIADELLPTGARDEGLPQATTRSSIGQARRGFTRSGHQTSRSGPSSSTGLCPGMGQYNSRCSWKQPDELLPGAQERGIDPAQAPCAQLTPGRRAAPSPAYRTR